MDVKGSEQFTSTTDTSMNQSPYPSAGPPPGPPPPYPTQAPPGYPTQVPPGYPTQVPPGYPGSQPVGAYPPQGYPVQQAPGQMYYSGQTTQGVILQQPGMVIVQPPMGVVPPDYQALAWFACLCCCWPLGIVAIIRSNEVRSACARGDYNSANIASRSARTFSFLSIGIGIAFLVLYIILVVAWLIPLLTVAHSYNYGP